MTAGEALDRDHTAGYNCSYIPINDVRSFDEVMYILLCGTGVGFSVERSNIEKLPVIAEEFEDTDTIIVVQDSKAGWAKSFLLLVFPSPEHEHFSKTYRNLFDRNGSSVGGSRTRRMARLLVPRQGLRPAGRPTDGHRD